MQDVIKTLEEFREEMLAIHNFCGRDLKERGKLNDALTIAISACKELETIKKRIDVERIADFIDNFILTASYQQLIGKDLAQAIVKDLTKKGK